MSDDRFQDWDPSGYEPEPNLNGGYRNPPRAPISDRNNAAIHYALEEFYKNMSDHEVSMGREFTAAEVEWPREVSDHARSLPVPDWGYEEYF